MNAEMFKKSGLQLFTKGTSLISRIICRVDGDEASHQAGVYYDEFWGCWIVAEMKLGGWRLPYLNMYIKGGLKKSTLERWLEVNEKHFVLALDPGLSSMQADVWNTWFTDTEIIGYDIGALFGFFGKKYKRLGRPELFFCSELMNCRLKKVGVDICRGQDEKIESPQDTIRALKRPETIVWEK